MSTFLKGKKPILVTDDSGQRELLPWPELIYNFELLHFFLAEVVRDWKRASTPYQSHIKPSESEGELSAVSACAFIELQPVFLKCVFSYAMFFVAADSAYETLYSQLNRANRISKAHVKHRKPPKESSIIERVRKVRNLSIVHLASAKARELDARSAMSWQPLSWSKPASDPWNLDQMKFGAFRHVRRAPDGTILSQSEEIELPGIPELNRECLDYLEKFDRVCAEYLDRLHKELVDTQSCAAA